MADDVNATASRMTEPEPIPDREVPIIAIYADGDRQYTMDSLGRRRWLRPQSNRFWEKVV